MSVDIPGDGFGRPEMIFETQNTPEELNDIITALRDRMSDFRAATEISWLNIIPTVLKFSVSLHVQARGADAVRLIYDSMIRKLDADGGAPVAAHLEYVKPPLSKERFSELVETLVEAVRQMTAQGYQLEPIAQAFAGYAMTNAELVADGDPWLLKSILAETARELQSGAYGA